MASSASLQPPLLSVVTFLSTTTSSLVYTQLLWSLSVCTPTLCHVHMASGPEDVGATNGRAGGGAEGEERLRTNPGTTDTLHDSASLAWL